MVKQNLNGVVAAQNASRTRSIAFVGLTVAILAVSAWITVPLGPIPFTLQTFAVAFAVLVLSPKEALAAMGCYLLLGAVGVPVFSGMRGGIGVLMGPTGGFLWGMLLGIAAAGALLSVMRGQGNKLSLPVEIAAVALIIAVTYLCGVLQYMLVASVGIEVAFFTCVAPFVVVDACKILAAVFVARQVRAAVGR